MLIEAELARTSFRATYTAGQYLYMQDCQAGLRNRPVIRLSHCVSSRGHASKTASFGSTSAGINLNAIKQYFMKASSCFYASGSSWRAPCVLFLPCSIHTLRLTTPDPSKDWEIVLCKKKNKIRRKQEEKEKKKNEEVIPLADARSVIISGEIITSLNCGLAP